VLRGEPLVPLTTISFAEAAGRGARARNRLPRRAVKVERAATVSR